jgi:hypothetical protein
VELKDLGQSFTEWHLDEDGIVVDSRPAGAEIWRGVKVRNHHQLRAGSELHLVLANGDALTLDYRAAMVVRLPRAQEPGRAG